MILLYYFVHSYRVIIQIPKILTFNLGHVLDKSRQKVYSFPDSSRIFRETEAGRPTTGLSPRRLTTAIASHDVMQQTPSRVIPRPIKMQSLKGMYIYIIYIYLSEKKSVPS